MLGPNRSPDSQVRTTSSHLLLFGFLSGRRFRLKDAQGKIHHIKPNCIHRKKAGFLDGVFLKDVSA